MNVIIIDDEEHARENLKRRLLRVDAEINIVDMAANATEGFIAIKNHDPDLVFIDIEMPGGDGFSVLEKFDVINFEVIFVTAYSEYALRAFELMAIGYVTKPIDNELLEKVYNKAKESQSRMVNSDVIDDLVNKIESLSKASKVALPSEKGLELIESDSIVMLQSSDGYTKIFLEKGKNIISSKRLKYFEEKLDSNFVRMHKSSIININYIKNYHKAGIVMLADGQEFPVGRKYKAEIERLLND